MQFRVLSFVFLSFLLAGGSFKTAAQVEQTVEQKVTTNPLLGTWKLKQIQYLYEGKVVSVEMDIPGTMFFTESDYVLTYSPWRAPNSDLLRDPWRMAKTPFKLTGKAVNEDIQNSIQTTVFNSGSYQVEGDTVITTLKLAVVEGVEGGTQYYRYQADDTRLDITLYDQTYPNDDKPEWHGKLNVRYLLEKDF